MPQETISQRLKILIKALGLNPRSFSEKYGVNEGTTRGYTTRGSIPNADYIATLLRAIAHLNAQWLLLGEGEMFLLKADSSTTNTAHIKKNSGIAINNSTTTQHTSLDDCQRNLEASQREIEQLKVLLAAKDDLIAAKEEMLMLLRAGHNRPN